MSCRSWTPYAEPQASFHGHLRGLAYITHHAAYCGTARPQGWVVSLGREPPQPRHLAAPCYGTMVKKLGLANPVDQVPEFLMLVGMRKCFIRRRDFQEVARWLLVLIAFDLLNDQSVCGQAQGVDADEAAGVLLVVAAGDVHGAQVLVVE